MESKRLKPNHIRPGIVPFKEAEEGDCVAVRGELIGMVFYQKEETEAPTVITLAVRDNDKLYMVTLYPIVYNRASEYIREGEEVLVAGVLQKLPDGIMWIIALEIDSWKHYVSLRLVDPFNKLVP